MEETKGFKGLCGRMGRLCCGRGEGRGKVGGSGDLFLCSGINLVEGREDACAGCRARVHSIGIGLSGFPPNQRVAVAVVVSFVGLARAVSCKTAHEPGQLASVSQFCHCQHPASQQLPVHFHIHFRFLRPSLSSSDHYIIPLSSQCPLLYPLLFIRYFRLLIIIV